MELAGCLGWIPAFLNTADNGTPEPVVSWMVKLSYLSANG